MYYRFDQGDAGENNTSLPNEVVDHTNTHHGVLNNFAMAGDSSNWLATGYDAALVLSTIRAHNVTGETANVSAEIHRTGSALVSVRGVCYSSANNSPTADDSTVEEVNPGGISAGEYTTSLSGLDGNTQYYTRAFASNEVETIYGETCQFTTRTSPNAPDSQACDIVFSHITQTQATIAWTNGNGDNRAVFLLQGDSGVAPLNDNTSYSASSIFGQGDQIGDTGWYCVYNGADSSVNVTGLVTNTTYRAMVCEYYNSSGSEIYNAGTASHNPENTPMSQFYISMGLYNYGISGDTDWGDYDNDGDLDLLAVGGGIIVSGVFRNNNGNFSDINAGLIQVANGSVAWGDYDNDGDLDILLTGIDYDQVEVCNIYQNNDGLFHDINAGLLGVNYGSSAWGDYDNDGDLDIVITGKNFSIGSVSRIYRNDDGVFTDIDAGLIDVEECCVEWGDYDNDGDLDILFTGSSSEGGEAIIYRNDGGIFTDIHAGLLGVTKSGAAWGDYDNDGDLDIFILGYNELNIAMSKIYRNDGGIFTDIHANLVDLAYGDAAWGDYDNDGDLDLLLSGEHANNNYHSFVYRNDDGVFTDIEAGLPGLTVSKVDWGDYDNDGDLDFMLCGTLAPGSFYSYRCRNNMGTNTFTTNTAPDAPTNFEISFSDDEYVCSWDASADDITPVECLTYNLQMGYGNQGTDIVSPMAQLSDGWRMITAMGSQNHNTQWALSSLPLRYQVECVGRVQAIDGAYMGSSFSAEDTFCLYPELVNEDELAPEGVLSWETQSQFLEIIEGYQVQIDVTTAFTNPIIDQVVYPEDDTRSAAQASRIGASSKETALVTLSASNPETVQRTDYHSVQLNELTNYGDLVGGTVYYWRTRPIYSDSIASVFTVEEKSFTYVAGNSAPNPPTDGFSPANDDPVSSLTPMISWNAATDPDSSDTPDLLRYFVELDTLDVFSAPVVTDSTTVGNPHIQLEDPLISGYRYYYRVKTIDDEDAESEWSVTQQFVTLLPPQNVIIACGEEGVTLSWEAMATNLGNMVYTVYSSSDPEAIFPDEWAVEAVNLGTTSWQDSDATAPMKFYIVTVGSASREATSSLNTKNTR